MKIHPLILTASLAASLPSAAPAQTTAFSDPVGFTTVTVRGKNGSTNANSYFSLGLTRNETWRGTATAKSLDTNGRTVVAVSDGPASGTLTRSGGGSDHYLQVLDGPNAGAVSTVVSNGTGTITVADNLNAIIDPGTTMLRLVPHWTMITAFPGGGGLNGGVSPTLADTVTLYPPNGSATTFFWHSSSGQWRRGLSNESHAILPPGSGVLVTRKKAGDVRITVAGVVPTTAVEVPVGSGGTSGKLTLASNPHPIASVTLAASGLYTGDGGTGMVGGASPSTADTLTIYNPATGIGVNYYYNTSANQWRWGLSNASSVTIPEGAAVMINRKAGRQPFSWYAPAPAMTLQ